MKKIIGFIAAVIFFQTAFAQASETTYQLEKKATYPAYTIQINFPPDVVEDALNQYIKDKTGDKGKSYKSGKKFAGEIISEISPAKLDFYTVVEKKSKKEKNVSNVYFLVSTGYENFVGSANDATIANNAITFLNNLNVIVNNYRHGQDISSQEEVVKKANRKNDDLSDDIRSTEKKIAELQKKLEDLRKEKTAQEAAVANESKKLEELKTAK